MKISKSLLTLAPFVMLSLCSCGGEPEQSSSSASNTAPTSSGTSVASSSSATSPEVSSSSNQVSSSGDTSKEKASVNVNPNTPEEYFESAETARKATSEAEKIRIYTPHANKLLNVPENGYFNLNFGIGIDMKQEEASSESSDSPSFFDLGEIFGKGHSISVAIRDMPFDLRMDNIQQGKDEVVASFTDYIEDRMANCTIKFDSISRDRLDMAMEGYIEGGNLYLDLSTISSLSNIFFGRTLPGKGRMYFELPEDFSIPSLLSLGLPDEDGEKDVREAFKDLFDALGIETFDFTDLLDTVRGMDIKLYEATNGSLWKLEDNQISLNIEGESDFLDFMMAVYDINKPAKDTEQDRLDIKKNIEDTLDYVDFDHFRYALRFDESGIRYNAVSFLINSFDKAKILEGQAESSVSVYPTGSLGYSCGLYYDYKDVEPEKLRASEKARYELVDNETVIEDLIDIIRDFIPEKDEEAA